METLLILGVLMLLAVPLLLLAGWVMLSSLRQTVTALSARVAALEQAPPAAAEPAAQTADPEPAVPAQALPEEEPAMVAPVAVHEPPPLMPPAPVPPQAVAAKAAAQPPPDIPPDAIERAFARVWAWLFTGNLPVKVGMLVLLAGVAALLKYAGDQGWLRMPMELRLAGISLAAVAALVFAWDRRERQRTFALAMQGGAIGVLLLVVFAAARLYAFINPLLAFSLSVVLIASAAVLAVVQHSRTLAVLSVLAGFMAPIWLSDGSGSHVALFAWYALLNAGIFAIAWLRPWRVLNLIGFGFTWGIGLIWGVLHYHPSHFASAQVFLALFFTFYLLLPILYARRDGSARMDATLLFATPLIAFSLQAGLLQGQRLPLALCALAVAAVYALLGWALKERERLRALGQGYAILAVGFATLAVPLGLSATATSAIFALEGAGLIWVGLTQQRPPVRWCGIGLQLAAALAWLLADTLPYAHTAMPVVIANAACMGGLVMALSGFVISWLYRRAGESQWALAAYGWGLLWWLGILGREIFEYTAASAVRHWPYEAAQPFVLNAFLLLFGLTAWLAAEAHRRWADTVLALTAAGALALAFVTALLHYSDAPFAYCGRVFSVVNAHIAGFDCSVYPAPTGGTWVWLLFALMGVRCLNALRKDAGPVWFTQLVWLLLWTSVLSLEFWHVHFSAELPASWRDDILWAFTLSDPLPTGWRGALTILPWLALLAAALWRWHWLCWPLGAAFDRARRVLAITALLVIALWWQLALFSPGGSAPLPWLALLNPLDLTQITALLLAGECWRRQPWTNQHASMGWTVLALAGFALVTVMTLRAAHHWGGVAWDDTMGRTIMVQSSLTVAWSILGAAGWVIGSRRGVWALWLGGALLLGLVLIKLLLVDRQNLGDLVGIGAVIAYALLCILIGWLAPAPPRKTSTESETEGAA